MHFFHHCFSFFFFTSPLYSIHTTHQHDVNTTAPISRYGIGIYWIYDSLLYPELFRARAEEMKKLIYKIIHTYEKKGTLFFKYYRRRWKKKCFAWANNFLPCVKWNLYEVLICLISCWALLVLLCITLSSRFPHCRPFAELKISFIFCHTVYQPDDGFGTGAEVSEREVCNYMSISRSI